MTFFIGVDLGQAQDPTAICVLERSQRDTGKWEDAGGYEQRRVYEYSYIARYLERLPLGTSYPRQVARVKQLSDTLIADTGRTPVLVVDQTGVGRAVVDLMRDSGLSPVGISIHGGDAVSRDGRDWRVPKKDLVTEAMVLLESKKLKVIPTLPDAEVLIAELKAFKLDTNARGHTTFGNDVGSWRENPHDDLVLAVALACWYGEKYREHVNDIQPSVNLFRPRRW